MHDMVHGLHAQHLLCICTDSCYMSTPPLPTEPPPPPPRVCSIAIQWPWPHVVELPNIAAYAYQDVHVWSAL